jgi:hypothetical protein
VDEVDELEPDDAVLTWVGEKIEAALETVLIGPDPSSMSA